MKILDLGTIDFKQFDRLESTVGDIVIHTTRTGSMTVEEKIVPIYETAVIKGPEGMVKGPKLLSHAEEEAHFRHLAMTVLVDGVVNKYKSLWWRWIAWPTVRKWLFFR